MFVNRITIVRDGYYGYGKADPSKPLRTTIEVEGQHGKVELNLSPALSDKVVKIIADEIAAAGRATAEALTAQCLSAKPTKQLAA
jgi:hypothetical protein